MPLRHTSPTPAALVTTERQGHAIVLTLNRPEKRNALNSGLLDTLTQELEGVAADDAAGGIVLTGGPSCFSAGADLTEAVDVTTYGDFQPFASRAARAIQAVEESPKPVIGALHGPCLTGGLELALACDYRIASPDATFAITSARIGSVAGFGGTQRLPRVIGASHAKEMLFTGRVVEAEEALALGLVDRLVEQEQVRTEACSLVDRIADVGPLSVAMMKKAVNAGTATDLHTGLELERALSGFAFTTSDKREGMQAFLEKRRARFTGR